MLFSHWLFAPAKTNTENTRQNTCCKPKIVTRTKLIACLAVDTTETSRFQAENSLDDTCASQQPAHSS